MLLLKSKPLSCQTHQNWKTLNKSKWTYISHQGEKGFITIFHSPKLGHFVVLYNDKIVLADKKVFGQDSYSFFIEEELCIIDIKVIDNRYDYQFRVDMAAITPLNQLRKENNRKNLFYSLLSFGGLFTAVAITMLTVFVVQDNQKWASIKDYGVLSVATIRILDGKYHTFSVLYTYRDSTQYIQGFLETFDTPNPILTNGFPVQNDDAFLVTYSNKIKSNNKIHLEYPTKSTVQRYRSLAQMKYLQNNPEATVAYCDCILDIAYKTKEWQGFSLIYNANTKSDDNQRFNQKKYQEWIRSSIFLDEEINCWQFK